jgi:hypothetical protein
VNAAGSAATREYGDDMTRLRMLVIAALIAAPTAAHAEPSAPRVVLTTSLDSTDCRASAVTIGALEAPFARLAGHRVASIGAKVLRAVPWAKWLPRVASTRETSQVTRTMLTVSGQF